MWYGGNGNMDCMMNELFIQVMDKFNGEPQLHVGPTLCQNDNS
jgi:hypothetical protein